MNQHWISHVSNAPRSLLAVWLWRRGVPAVHFWQLLPITKDKRRGTILIVIVFSLPTNVAASLAKIRRIMPPFAENFQDFLDTPFLQKLQRRHRRQMRLD